MQLFPLLSMAGKECVWTGRCVESGLDVCVKGTDRISHVSVSEELAEFAYPI